MMLESPHRESHHVSNSDDRQRSDAAVAIGTTPDSLLAVTRPDITLALWERQADSEAADWLAALPAKQIPHGRVLIAPAETGAALEAIFEQCGTPAGPLRDRFAADIALLVDRYAAIAETELVDMRVERVEGDSCWKFHRDAVRYRLLCTYRGPSTQWVTPDHADAALEAQLDFAGPLRQTGLWTVAMFKNSIADDSVGIVHRSPQIHGTGVSRFLLCLNEQSIVSPQRWKG